MIRLWSSRRSPYVRIVTLALHELDLADKVGLCPVSVSQKTPQANPGLAADNPMVSIPTIVFEDGRTLSESALICLALDRRFSPGSLVPLAPSEMEQTFAQVATAKLMIDALMQLRLYPAFRENDVEARLEGYRWKIEKTLDHFERDTHPGEIADVDLGDLTLAVGLSYLDFRLPEIRWRELRPKLTGWYERFATRPSFKATEYADG